MRRSSPSRVTERMRPRHTSSIDGGAGAGEQAAGVVAAEERGRQVEHVAVDEARARGSRGRRWRRPRRAPAGGPWRRARRAARRGRPGARGTGAPWRPAGASPSTTRSGSPRGAGASRTVRLGSSARTVPAPTRIASLSARRRVGVGAGLGAGDPLAGAVGRGGAAVERRRQLQHDVRPAGAAVVEVRRQQRRRPRPLARPTSTLDAGRRAAARCPARRPAGPGPRWRPPPGRRRRRSSASAHGGVRPWCEHGSRVTHAVAPREVVVAGRGQRRRLGVGAADGCGRALRTPRRRRPRSRSRPTGSAA